MSDFKIILSLLLTVLSITSCIVDCSRNMDDTKLVFTNYTDSTVAIFLPKESYPIVILGPKSVRNSWVYHEPDAYQIQIGNRTVIDSLNPIQIDSVNVFKDKVTNIYTIGKRKCKKNMTDIQYFITEKTLKDAK